MSTVAEQFAGRFDAALRIKRTDRAAQAPYDRLNEFVRTLAGLADVEACLDRYLAIYPRYAKDDPRSEMIFAMLAERRIRLTELDDEFVDRLYEEIFGHRTPSAVAARIRELEANRRNGILKVLKEARDQRQRGGGLVDPLQQMYRRAHDGRPATSVDELYDFDPLPDPRLQAEYQRIVDGLDSAWRVAEQRFSSRSYAYTVATEVTEAVRLRTTGYAGFALRLQAFQEYLAGKRSDERVLFQLLKWSRDTVRPVRVVKGGKTYSKATGTHLEFEIYVHIVFAIYLNAVQYRHLLRKPEGFTAAEAAFFLEPIRRATYRSNFVNRFKLVFPGGGKPSNVENFTKLAGLYAQLILFARSQNLDLVDDERALEIQRAIESTPWQELVGQRFSTKGMSTWAYAQDTFARGDRIGTDIDVAYFEGSRPTVVYLELEAAPGFLFKASLSSFTRKVETGLYKLVWEQNRGLIVLAQKYFEIIGYLPVLVEAGFVGLIKQVAQDQLIAAGLADASEAFGVDLDGLALILPLLPVHKLAGGGGRGGRGSVDLATQRAVTSQEATANKALTTLAGDDATVVNRLTPGDTRLAKMMDTPLSSDEQRMAKAIDKYLDRDQQRMAKAIEKYLDRNEQRMVRVQQQAAEQQAQVVQRAHAGGTARVQDGRAQAVAGGGVGTDPASRPARDGRTTAGPTSAGGPSRADPITGGGAPNAGSAGGAPRTGSQPPQRPPRRVHVTVEPPVRPPVDPHPPAEPAGVEAVVVKTGRQVEDEELRKHVLEHLAEKVRGENADITEFLGVHGPVTIEGRRFGGGNRFSAIADRLEEVSKLRAQRKKKPLVIQWNPDELQSTFIFRHADLKADYDRLKSLATSRRVPPAFEHLDLSPKRIGQIREELEKMAARQVGALQPDIVEIWFGRWPKVQVADITLAGNDPYHLFKTKVYKRIMENMLPGFKVFGFDIKPMSNGSYRFFRVD